MLAFCVALALGAAEFEPAAFFAGNDELRAYIVEAVENSPMIRARHNEWLAALERAPQVTLDDPMFSFTSFLQSDQERFAIEVEQMFPWFGTLRNQRGRAAAETRAALARAYAARNDVIASVKMAYFDLTLLAQETGIIESQAQIYDFIESTTLSRYSLGLARQEDVLRVQVAKTQLEDRHTDLVQSRPAFEAKFFEALGRNGVPGDLAAPQPATFPPDPPPPPVVLARVTMANPELAAADEEIDAKDFDIALAKKTGYPNFTVGIGFGKMKDPPGEDFNRMAVRETAFMLARDASTRGVLPVLSDEGFDLTKKRLLAEDMDMKDDVMVTVRMNVPIWRGRVRAATQEAHLMQQAAENEKERTRLSLSTAARMALYNIQAAQRRYGLYDDTLMPQAQNIYENLQTGYGLGDMTDVVDLIESVNTMLEFQLEQARAARDLQNAAAQLEQLMGGPWEAEATKQ